MSLNSNQTYSLAHTAQCKLRISADRPDRNLRFILGHAFTFDKIMMRIVEIEDEQNSAKQKQADPTDDPIARGVSFADNSNRPSGDLRGGGQPKSAQGGRRAASPPPNALEAKDDSDSSDTDEYALDDEDDEPGLSLTKTVSHIARPPPGPPGLAADGDSSDEDDEPNSPPSVPPDAVLATIMEEEGDEEMAGLYETVRNCGCQNHVKEKAPAISSIWEVPQKTSKMHGGRTAVVQVQA